MRRLCAASLALLTLATLSCGGDDEGPTGPTVGALEVTLSMSGEELDPDGCQVSVDGGSPEVLTEGSSVSFTGLEAGSHSVLLDEVASNCTVEGLNPRIVNVSASSTTPIVFSVTCSATTGSIEVHLTMTGEYLDADGCQVSIDGGDSRLLEPGAPVLFTELSPDAHSLLVDGVAANCSIQGENPRNVGVVVGQTTQTTYVIECTPCGAGYGPYQAVDLGTLGGKSSAMDINEHGQVVAYSELDAFPLGSFLWENGVMIVIGAGIARAINEAGQVVGTGGANPWETTAGGAYLWENGIFTELPAISHYSVAYDINDRGQIVGGSGTAVIWENGVVTRLGSNAYYGTAAWAINNVGQVIGQECWEDHCDDSEHFLWENGEFLDHYLPLEPADINDHGQVIGRRGPQAVVWEEGVLTELASPDDTESRAYGINNCGQVVGQVVGTSDARAVMWDAGVMTDLGMLPGYDIARAVAISDRGQIVGYSALIAECYSTLCWGNNRATLWTRSY